MSRAWARAFRSITSRPRFRSALVHTLAAQQAGPPQHGIERRAQLVRQDGQELVLRAVGGFRLPAGVLGRPLLGNHLTGERLEVAIRVRSLRAQHVAGSLDRHQAPRPEPGAPRREAGMRTRSWAPSRMSSSAPARVLVRIGHGRGSELSASSPRARIRADGRSTRPARALASRTTRSMPSGSNVLEPPRSHRAPSRSSNSSASMSSHEPAAGFASDDERSRPIAAPGNGRGARRSAISAEDRYAVGQVPDSLFALG